MEQFDSSVEESSRVYEQQQRNDEQTTFWLENCNLLDKNSGLESV